MTLPGADVSVDVEDASKHASYTVYHVRVRRGAASWLVLRRFSDFQALHKALRKRMAVSGMRGVTLPPMPGKSLFKMSASVVTDRIAGFRTYLQVSGRQGRGPELWVTRWSAATHHHVPFERRAW